MSAFWLPIYSEAERFYMPNQRPTQWESRKVAVVGAGAVGASFAFSLMQGGSADEIVLVDKQKDLAEGQALDLAHSQPYLPNVEVRAGDEEDYRDADVIVITAGAPQKPGESRLDLIGKNARIMESIVDEIVQRDSKAVVLVVSNPVDVLTYVALERSGWDRQRVMGSGTVLDSARFRYLLSRHCGVDVRNVHAYILGEHGDSELAAWSMAHVAGLPMEEFCALCQRCENSRKARQGVVEEVRQSAYHIIDYKGATNWGIAMALTRIVDTILHNAHGVLTVSTRLEGEYGLEDVCLSVPCQIGSSGVERIVEGALSDEEKAGLAESARILQKNRKDSLGR